MTKITKKILISGSYGTGNTGDEVILKCIIDQFKDYNLTVLSQGIEYTQKNFPEVRVIHQTPSWELKRIFKDIVLFKYNELAKRVSFLNELRKADIFWLGGGGLLSEMIPRVLRYYLHQIYLANFFKCKVLLFAVGIGPLTTNKGKIFLKKTMQNVPLFISVRDDNSKLLLQEIGVTRDITVIPDPAFHFKACENDSNSQNVVFNFYPVFSNAILWPGQNERFHKQKDAIIELTRHMTEDLNYKVTYLPFGTKEDADFSISMLKNFQVDHPALAAKVDIYIGANYQEIVKILVSAKWSISMRFHAGLVAMANFRPSICIDQQFKSERLLSEIDLTELLVPLPDGYHKSGSQDLNTVEIKEKIKWLEYNYELIQQRLGSYVTKSQSNLYAFYKNLKEIIDNC